MEGQGYSALPEAYYNCSLMHRVSLRMESIVQKRTTAGQSRLLSLWTSGQREWQFPEPAKTMHPGSLPTATDR